MPRSRLFRLATVACFVTSLVHATMAMAIPPTASYVFPAGAQRGTKVSVRVGGMYLYDGTHFEMLGGGVKATSRLKATETIRFPKKVVPQTYFPQENFILRDFAGTVEVAEDAAVGMRYWRAWTSQGATGLSRFVIGDLPEVVEREVAGDAIAETVTLPVTANGRIYPREDVDVWSFDAKAGQPITCEVNAARIGSTLDAFVEVRDDQGRRLAESAEHYGADPLVRFVAPRDGKFFVRIYDVRFGGLQSSVYRLTITSGAHVDTVYPRGGRGGENVPLELIGQGTPQKPLAFPMNAGNEGPVLAGVRIGSRVHSLLLDRSNCSERLETEPNNEPEKGPVVQAPVVLNGRIDTSDDTDCWRLQGKKGQAVHFEFRARRAGDPLNPLLIVTDSKGKELHRCEGRTAFTLPADGVYGLQIREQFGRRGGARFIYRLHVGDPPAQDFRLTIPPSLALGRGGTADLTVNVERIGGFGGEIKLAVAGLPDGVTAAAASIPAGKKQGKIKLTAGKKVKISGSKIRLRGVAKIADKTVEREGIIQVDPGQHAVGTTLLALTLPTPFKFKGNYEIPFALRGTTHYRRYQLDRGGYQGQLYVRPADKQLRHQWGSRGTTIAIPANATTFDYPLQVSTWTKVGLTGRTVVMLFGEVEDFDGSKHMVAFSSPAANDQVMIQPSAGPLAIETQRESVLMNPRQPVRVPILVRRDPELRLPVTLSVTTANHVHGIKAQPVVLAADATEGVVEIEFEENAGPFNMPLTILATARPEQSVVVRGRPLREGDPIIAEVHVSVVTPR